MTPGNTVSLITICAAALLPFSAALGQSKGTATPTAPTAPTNTGIGTRPTTPTQPSTSSTPGTTPTIQQPIYISGRVLTEDGQPPPEPARIERVCNGSPHSEGFTDPKGNFYIELGGASNMAFQDASETGGFGSSGMGGMSGMGGSSNMGSQQGLTSSALGAHRFQNCEIRARVGGYRSQSVSLAMRMAMDNPDIGTILLHREGPDEGGTAVSARSLAAPKDARKAFDKGMESVKKGKQDEAVKSLEKAVAAYPEYSAAWCELGKIQASHGQADVARASFDRAAKADPKFVDPYLQLSLLALHEQKWSELADLTDQAGKLNSFDYPQVFLFSAVANFNLHNFDAAEKSIKQADHLDTRRQYPQIAHLYGVILAQRHDYPGASEHFRTYLKMVPNAPDGDKVRAQLVEMEKVTAQNPDGAPKTNQQ